MDYSLEYRRTTVRLVAEAMSLSLADSFNDRLILQRTMFLMEKHGFHVGYKYKWWLRGVYSSDLTKDAFAVADWPELSEGKHLSSKAKEFLDEILCDDSVDQAEWLNLLTTVVWWGEKNNWDEDKTRNMIASKHTGITEYVDSTSFNRALDALKKTGVWSGSDINQSVLA